MLYSRRFFHESNFYFIFKAWNICLKYYIREKEIKTYSFRNFFAVIICFLLFRYHDYWLINMHSFCMLMLWLTTPSSDQLKRLKPSIITLKPPKHRKTIRSTNLFHRNTENSSLESQVAWAALLLITRCTGSRKIDVLKKEVNLLNPTSSHSNTFRYYYCYY